MLLKVPRVGRRGRRRAGYLLAFLLLPVLTHQLAALAGDDGQIGRRVLHRDDGLRLEADG